MNYLQRVGGRHAITMPVWLLFLPLSVFGTVGFTPEGRAGAEIFLGWLTGLVAHLITGLVLLFARYTFLHDGDRRPRPYAAIATFLVAGAARGATVAFLFEVFDVVDQVAFVERVIAGALLTVILFGTAAILVDSRNIYRDTVARLESERARARLLADYGEQQLNQQRNELVEMIRVTLSEALQSARSSKQLHEAVDLVVRPLSHNLAREARLLHFSADDPPLSKVKFLPAVRAAFERHPFNILGTLIISMTATAFSRLWAFGWLAIPDLALMAVTIAGGFALLRRLGVGGWWAVVGIQVVAITSSTITHLVIGADPISEFLGVVLLSINISLPAIGIALFRGFEEVREQRIAQLREARADAQWQRSLIQSRAWVEQQRLGRFVHSEIQGRIRAAALRSSPVHGEELDPPVIETLKTECLRALDFSDDEPDLDAFIRDIIELWEGVCTVVFDVEEAAHLTMQGDPWAATAFIEITRGVILNAVKHGSASEVNIATSLSVEREQAVLVVVVNDNGKAQGTGTAVPGGAGLGLATIDELTVSSSFEVTAFGATLTAVIPTRTVNPPKT